MGTNCSRVKWRTFIREQSAADQQIIAMVSSKAKEWEVSGWRCELCRLICSEEGSRYSIVFKYGVWCCELHVYLGTVCAVYRSYISNHPG